MMVLCSFQRFAIVVLFCACAELGVLVAQEPSVATAQYDSCTHPAKAVSRLRELHKSDTSTFVLQSELDFLYCKCRELCPDWIDSRIHIKRRFVHSKNSQNY
jgi:hypothetical protein